MRKLVTILIILAISGYLVNSYLEKRAAEEEAVKRFGLAIEKKESVINDLVLETDAITDWVDQLGETKRSKFSTVLTYDLQRVWIQDRPILFRGSVQNVSIVDDSSCTILLEPGLLESGLDKTFFIRPETLRLRLTTKQRTWDDFFASHPDLFSGFGRANNVAVIAKIEKVISSTQINSGGTAIETKTGVGELIRIAYNGIEY